MLIVESAEMLSVQKKKATAQRDIQERKTTQGRRSKTNILTYFQVRQHLTKILDDVISFLPIAIQHQFKSISYIGLVYQNMINLMRYVFAQKASDAT